MAVTHSARFCEQTATPLRVCRPPLLSPPGQNRNEKKKWNSFGIDLGESTTIWNMYRYLSLETDQGKTDTRTNAPERKATSSKSGSAISIRSRRHTLLPLWPPPTIDTLNGPVRWLPANIRPFVREEKFFPFPFVGKIYPGNSRLISPTDWFQSFFPFFFTFPWLSLCSYLIFSVASVQFVDGVILYTRIFVFVPPFVQWHLQWPHSTERNVYFCYFTAVPSGIFRPIAVVPNSQCKFYSFFRSLAFLYWL